MDGNKRLGLAGALAFIVLNTVSSQDEQYELVMAVARGEADVSEVTVALRAAGIP